MKCSECPDYKSCVKTADLRAKRKRCQKAKQPAPDGSDYDKEFWGTEGEDEQGN